MHMREQLMAARKKTLAAPRVRVRATFSFDAFRIGDEFDTDLTPRVRALISNGALKVMGDGQSEARPGAVDADDSGGVPSGAEPAGATDPEPGEDPGTGEHGTASGVGED